MLVFLVGAKKNIGDYLIFDRAKKLFNHVLDEEIIAIDRFDYLDDQIETLNRARYIVLCGGPAYRENMFPGVYKLLKDMSKLKTPIIPFGLGWRSSKKLKDVNKFSFDLNTQNILESIHSKIETSSCRCIVTEEMLHKSNITNVTMTGCPVWYNVESLNKPFENKEIKKIVFTSPANPKLVKQTSQLLKITRKMYPNAKIYYSFHRGILPDRNTNYTAISYMLMSLKAKMIDWNIEVIDVSYNLDKIAFYKDCDLHIGYRVHAHLDFLSQRLPSLLINEDMRGLGMVKTMSLPELNVWDEDLVENFTNVLTKYKEENFASIHRIADFIDNQYKIMKKFIESL